MIYTCTLNPSLDYQIQTEKLEIGKLNRVEDTAYYPGGKGINVSRVLKNLHVESVALGFAGGFTGEYLIKCLHEADIKTDFVKHEAPTRVNVKVKTLTEETEINGNGTVISKEEQDQFIGKLKQWKEGDFLVISGSKPASVPITFYEEIIQNASSKDISFILDIPDVDVKTLLPYKPFLIKPNEQELSEITGYKIKDTRGAITGAKQLIQLGAENVIVSLGEKGAVFVNKHHVLQAKAPIGTLISSVGAGDSLIAGFIASLTKQPNILEAFKYGVAAGSATAFSQNLCERREVLNLLDQVIISNWKGE